MVPPLNRTRGPGEVNFSVRSRCVLLFRYAEEEHA
jgi:hypothetical protein